MLKALINFLKRLFNGNKKENNNQVNTSNQKESQIKNYKKKKLLTPTEIKFKIAIEKALSDDYILYPEINLATIIERTDEHKYQNELYRNIDFCIFDKKYNPILLIEINDNTHKQKARQARDFKVQDICQQADIPLIRFWTDYGVNEEYIKKKINEYLN